MKIYHLHRWWPVFVIAIAVIAGLVLRVDQFLYFWKYIYLSFCKYPWLGSGLLISSALYFFSAIFYNRFVVRLGAALFPFILLVGIGLNLQSFSNIDQLNLWHLQRLPTNNLIDLLQASHDPLYTRPVYILFEYHYKGRILVTPPGLLEDVGLSPELLRSWGRLAKVETLEYDSSLTDQEAYTLLLLDHIELETDAGEKYIFVTEALDSTTLLLITRQGGQTFIVPLNLLPDRGFNQ